MRTRSLGFCYICFVVISLSTAIQAFPQKTDSLQSYHVAGLQTGINQVREENLHRKVSTGIITGFNYGYERRNKNWQQFHLAIGYSRLKTELEDLSKSMNLNMEIAYSWNYRLVNNRKFKYYLGPAAGISYSFSFFPNWDDSHLYWADYYSVGVHNVFSVPLKNKNEWVTFVSLPLFSVFSRPDPYRLYKIDDTSPGGIIRNMNSNLAPAFLSNVFYLKVLTEYRFTAFRDKQEAFSFSVYFNEVKHNDGGKFSQLFYLLGLKFLL